MSIWMSSPNGKWHVGPDGASWADKSPSTSACGTAFIPRNVTASLSDKPPTTASHYCVKCANAQKGT